MICCYYLSANHPIGLDLVLVFLFWGNQTLAHTFQRPYPEKYTGWMESGLFLHCHYYFFNIWFQDNKNEKMCIQ